MTPHVKWSPLLLCACLMLFSGTVSAQDDADAILIEEPVIEEPAVDDLLDAAVTDEFAVPDLEPVIEEPAPDVPVLDVPVEPVIDLTPEPPVVDEPPPAAPEPEMPGGDDIVDRAVEDAMREGIPEAPPIAVPDTPVMVPDTPVAVPDTPVTMAPVAAGVSYSGIVGEEEARRIALEAHAQDLLTQADQAYKRKDYQGARKQYDTAAKLFQRPQVASLRKRAKDGLARSCYAQALLEREAGNLEDAKTLAWVSFEEGYDRGWRLAQQIEEEIKTPPPPKDPTPRPVSRLDEQEYKDRDAAIRADLKRGREHYIGGEYEKAQKVFESVLSRDPHNTEAIRLRTKVAQRMYDVATMELDSTRQDMMYELRDAWNPRDYGLVTVPGVPKVAGRKPEPGIETPEMRIVKLMEGIVIPEVDFHQANIHDVIEFLRMQSILHDPDDTKLKKGVDIILKLHSAGAPAVAAPVDDIFGADFGDTPVAPVAGGGAEDTPITFSARYISLMEALDIVMDLAELKYRIDGSIVMVVRADEPDADLITRMYNVLPTLIERIQRIQPDIGGGDDEFRALGTEGTGSVSVNLRTFFEEMGVMWPAGSAIKYVPSLGKLVVANTGDNLTRFERILAELNVVPSQIEIEARFVEVAQNDLNSLGFEWLLTDNWEIATKQGDYNLANQPRIQIDKNSVEDSILPGRNGGFTRANRYGTQFPIETLGYQDDVMRVTSILTNPELSVIIHAMEMKGNADLLSAPKVTTTAGNEATIKVVTEYIYPTDFDVTPITGTDANGNSVIVGGVVEPSGFETREVGVILAVLPEVQQEGSMIALTLTPEVVTEPEWRDYGSTYTAPDGSTQQLPMEQPFFHTRTVSTSIIIYNGATVVMGGMIAEMRNTIDDQIPFLGDIPILGRLFQSKIDSSEKRNLLIFVTARLVDPAGQEIKQSGMMPQVPSAETPPAL